MHGQRVWRNVRRLMKRKAWGMVGQGMEKPEESLGGMGSVRIIIVMYM